MNTTDFIALCVLLIVFVIYYNLEAIKDQFFDNDPSLRLDTNGSRDITDVLASNDKNYLILYGSQTGTAEDYARKFGKELSNKYQLDVMCGDLEDYDFDTLNEMPENVLVTFIISTYGEGDFPDGAAHFEQFLNEAEGKILGNVRFSIFGLGNTTYEFYNGAAKKAAKSLQEAGATLIGNIGAGDDGAGTTDEDYLTWKENTIDELTNLLNLSEHNDAFKPSFEYSELETIGENVSVGEPSIQYLPSKKLSYNSEGQQKGPFDLVQPYVAPIIKSHELFKSESRSCIHTEFDISGSEVAYETGDHLAIWPSNANEIVSQFLSVFNLKGNTIFDLKPIDSTVKLPFPCPTTIEAVVRNYIEITGPISRQSLGLLSNYAPEDIKERIIKLSKDKELFASEILSNKFNLADALLYLSDNQPWENVPWTFLIELLPKLQPRYYSISSSSLSEPNVIHVTSIVENTPNEYTGKPTLGVTTNLLRNIELVQNRESLNTLPVNYDLNGPRNLFRDFKLPIHVRHSTFKLPADVSVPVIMIGPGTGVAPFRGFVRERSKMMKTDNQLSGKMGKMMLFYGSRNDDDYLYKEEWIEHAKTLGDKIEIDVALSRVTDKKIYVQDKIRERKAEISELLNNGAHVYVCGDAMRMAKDVQKVLVSILSELKDVSIDEGQEMIKAMKVSGTYQEDIW